MRLTTSKKSKNTKQRKAILLVLGAILLVLIGTGLFLYSNSLRNNDKTVDGTNYTPPTQEEKDAGNTQKETNLEREENKNQTTKSTASIFIVDANQYDDTVEVSAYTPTIIEDGGICKATFTNQSFSSVTGTSEGRRDAQTTQCNTIRIPRSSFGGNGTWSMTLTYESSSVSGSSNVTNVTIK